MKKYEENIENYEENMKEYEGKMKKLWRNMTTEVQKNEIKSFWCAVLMLIRSPEVFLKKWSNVTRRLKKTKWKI